MRMTRPEPMTARTLNRPMTAGRPPREHDRVGTSRWPEIVRRRSATCEDCGVWLEPAARYIGVCGTCQMERRALDEWNERFGGVR